MYNYSSYWINIHLCGFHYGNHLWIFIFLSYIRTRVYIAKITEPLNGIVSFILNNRRKFGRASDRGCEAGLLFMDYGLLFPIYGDGIKPERKLCWLRINASVISHMVYPNVVGLYQY